jgi:L-amino acid N-acyltransferase YncA
MKNKFEIRDVDAGNIDESGFFCYMSKRKEPGYKQKREWLEERFAEGMKIKILHEHGGRDVAFIEYIPGEYAWRAVHAPGYMVIHCLWVVGKGKGKGYGSHLIHECLNDARAQKMKGVAMLTSDRTWLASKDIFERNGFVEVDQAPPSFQLMAIRFGSGPSTTLRTTTLRTTALRTNPELSLPKDWDERARAFGRGLTVIRTAQCPYIENATNAILSFAKERNIKAKVVEFKTAREVQEQSPSAYGVFGSVLDGRFLAYYYLLPKDFDKLMMEHKKGE